MDHFALTCTTCKSRLKVRDSGAIGQIMACPKCGGMVLVKPPDANSPPPAASDTGETRPDLSNPLRPAPLPPANQPLKSDAFDAIDELLGNVPTRTMVPTPTVRPNAAHPAGQHAARMEAPKGTPPTVVKPSEAKKSPDSQAKTLSQDDISVAKPHPAIAPQPASRAAAAAVVAPLAVAPATAQPRPAASETTSPMPMESEADSPLDASGTLGGSPWQYWAIVSASGLLGIVLAIGVVVISISWFSKPPAPVTPPIAQRPDEPAVPAAPENKHESPTSPLVPPENPQVNVGPEPPVESEPLPVAPPPKPMDPALIDPAPMPPVAERDPLGLTEPVPAPKPLNPKDDPLGKFGDLLGGNDNPLPPEPAPQPAPPPLEEEPSASPTTPLLPKPQPRHIDIAARLADPLPAIEINASPLADFLQVMQDFSTIPITLRPDGLGMVKLTPFSSETPITWQGKTTTVHEAIQAALAPLGLEARIEADQLVVDVASSQLATITLAVKDLTGSDEQRAAELAAALQSLVAPDSWRDDETGPSLTISKDELHIKQQRVPLAECVLVAEKLRIARGLRPQSRFDAKLFELTTRTQKARAALNTPITLNYSQPTPLLRVLERLGKTANLRILVDWQALSAAGWNPAAEATLTVEKLPLAKTLDDLTQRMELTWRIVDARTLQITTPQALADRTEFELHPLGNLLTDEAAATQLVAKLRTSLGNEHFRDAGGRGELRFDLAGKCLLASLPQPQQRQLAALLEKK